MDLLKSLSQTESKELIPGFEGKFIHTDAMTLVYWDVRANAELPEHSHFHEQVCNLLEGEFELSIDGKCYHLKPGDVLTIPRDAKHSGRALTDCRILDVFQPVREDYQ